jgi:CheY-like chemotaxis protein
MADGQFPDPRRAVRTWLARGAFSFIRKPSTADGLAAALQRIKAYVKRCRRRLLVIEDNPVELGISEPLGHDDLELITAGTGGDALKALREQQIDCAVLDLRLPDMSGFDVLEMISNDPALSNLPIVVFNWQRAVSRRGCPTEHRVIADLPEDKRNMLERPHRSGEDLVGKKVLLVDGDARNIFALSSALERRGINVFTATTGDEAIARVQSTPGLAIVLMDNMMPEMDGYQTMQIIRANPAFSRLPIIALTAKATKGDREKCIEAGASDYLAKPVDTEQLLSGLRMWMHR